MSRRQWTQLIALLLVAGIGIFFTLRNEDTRKAAVRTERVVAQNTCGQGNRAACVRVCENLGGSWVSGRCGFSTPRHLTRAAIASGGDLPAGEAQPNTDTPTGGRGQGGGTGGIGGNGDTGDGTGTPGAGQGQQQAGRPTIGESVANTVNGAVNGLGQTVDATTCLLNPQHPACR